MKIQRIIVPVDFSEPSQAAIEVAIDWARAFKATLHLLHVVQINPTTRPGLEYALIDERYTELVEEDARTQLRRITDRFADVQSTSTIRYGRPAPQIAAYAAEMGADLVVMATHGRRGWQRLMLGSTTEEVVRIATCPVVTIHQQVKPLETVATVESATPSL